MPIGFFGLLVGIGAVLALGAGIYLLLRAQAVARAVKTPGNDIESGARLRRGRPKRSGRGIVIAGVVFTLAALLALAVLVLVATGVIGSDQTRTDPTAQRP